MNALQTKFLVSVALCVTVAVAVLSSGGVTALAITQALSCGAPSDPPRGRAHVRVPTRPEARTICEAGPADRGATVAIFLIPGVLALVVAVAGTVLLRDQRPWAPARDSVACADAVPVEASQHLG